MAACLENGVNPHAFPEYSSIKPGTSAASAQSATTDDGYASSFDIRWRSGNPSKWDCLENSEFGKMLKTLVDGGSEGVCMGIGIVCGAAGAQLTTHHVLVLGFSGLSALSVGLGLNELLSFRAQNLFVLNEYARGRERLQENRSAELVSVVDTLVSKGVMRSDAVSVVSTLSKYDDFFLGDVYMPQVSQQLMQQPPQELLEWKPLVAEAFSTFLAVLVVGALPLLGAVAVFVGQEVREEVAFMVFYVLAGGILFATGALKSCFFGVTWWQAGLQTLLVGFACGIAGFSAGAFVNAVNFAPDS